MCRSCLRVCLAVDVCGGGCFGPPIGGTWYHGALFGSLHREVLCGEGCVAMSTESFYSSFLLFSADYDRLNRCAVLVHSSFAAEWLALG